MIPEGHRGGMTYDMPAGQDGSESSSAPPHLVGFSSPRPVSLDPRMKSLKADRTAAMSLTETVLLLPWSYVVYMCKCLTYVCSA